MIIKPNKIYAGTFSIPYRVPSGWRRFIYDSENRVFEIMNDLDMRPCGTLKGISGNYRISGVSFHPQKEVAAFVTEDGMTVSDFNGNRLWAYKAPVNALLFSRDGSEVWVAENIDSKTLFVSVIETDTGIENSANTMEDTLYESSLGLYHAPEVVLMELAAGQDGCEIWKLDDTDSAMRYQVVFPNDCHIMPAFSTDGQRLLTLENDERLYYSYDWPEKTLISKQRAYSEEEWADEDAMPGYSIVYLKNGLSVVQSATDRLYLFDPVKMERLMELVIEGFEPVPTNKIFPNLKDESLYSPIAMFERMGDIILAKTSKYVKNQAMLLFTEDELIQQISC